MYGAHFELDAILKGLMSGNYVPTLHAMDRMVERNVGDADIQSVGRNPSRTEYQGDGKYRIDGFDRDGDPLTVIAAYDGQTVVITVF